MAILYEVTKNRKTPKESLNIQRFMGFLGEKSIFYGVKPRINEYHSHSSGRLNC